LMCSGVLVYFGFCYLWKFIHTAKNQITRAHQNTPTAPRRKQFRQMLLF